MFSVLLMMWQHIDETAGIDVVSLRNINIKIKIKNCDGVQPGFVFNFSIVKPDCFEGIHERMVEEAGLETPTGNYEEASHTIRICS